MTLPFDSVPITPETLRLIAEVDEFKGAWQALGQVSPERLSGLRRVATIESVGSSTRIEGSTLTDAEVDRLLASLEVRALTSRDEQEVAGYAQVMETVFASHDAIALTENHILQLHRDLLAHSTKDERHCGAYKKHPNSVSAFDADGRELGTVFQTASPFDTPRLMQELIGWTRGALEARSLHPLLVTGAFSVVFLEIHPFQDGNGRLSRILTTLLLLRSGYSYVPYSSLESVIEQTKESYYRALLQTQRTLRTPAPDWNPWLVYFLRALQVQKDRLARRLAQERILDQDLPPLSRRILDLVQERGTLTIREVVALLGANRNTVKKHLQALVASRHLVLHGSGKGAWYGRG